MVVYPDGNTNEESPLLKNLKPTGDDGGGKKEISARSLHHHHQRWSPLLILCALAGAVALVRHFVAASLTQKTFDQDNKLKVAFVGNSMFYFNGKPVSRRCCLSYEKWKLSRSLANTAFHAYVVRLSSIL